MTLYIDQGNSRIKLWLIEAGAMVAEQVCDDALAAARWLQGLGAQALDVRLASVAGEAADEALSAALQPFAASLAFARVDVGRLPTAYAAPGRLGVDRWLAVLAATPAITPAIIVDAGTAFTVDALSADGRHLGGYILPGLSLQRDALAARTARVSFPAPDWSRQGWGEDTSACVCNGSLLALSALVRSACERLQAESGLRPRMLLTGGDAERFAPFLEEAELHPWLVLEGLAVYFDDAEVLALWRGRR